MKSIIEVSADRSAAIRSVSPILLAAEARRPDQRLSVQDATLEQAYEAGQGA